MSFKLLKVKEIEKILGIKIKNKNIWLEAITHKSWLFLHPEMKLNNNERLEFLGDSILQIITSWYLYRTYPSFSEGELSIIRSNLINRERLSEIAEELKIEKILLIGKGIDKEGKKTILGDSLEAIIGAIFLDQGFEFVKNFIEKNILADAYEVIKKDIWKNPKSLLQEYFQEKYKKTPVYKVVEILGPSHKPNFRVEVYLDDQKIGEGMGSSKQKAEIDAAQKILKNYLT